MTLLILLIVSLSPDTLYYQANHEFKHMLDHKYYDHAHDYGIEKNN